MNCPDCGAEIMIGNRCAKCLLHSAPPPGTHICGGTWEKMSTASRDEVWGFYDYLSRQGAYRKAFAAWEAGGRQGDPPPRPVKPHTPGAFYPDSPLAAAPSSTEPAK